MTHCEPYVSQYTSPIGPLWLLSNGEALTGLYFAPHPGRGGAALPLHRQAAAELTAYFQKELRAFTLPICLEGTDFRKKVWQALTQIPYGETITYGELAARVGDAKASRAVGQANHFNPISIIVPCHRVVGAGGKLTGYGGGIEKKIFLLQLEGAR